MASATLFLVKLVPMSVATDCLENIIGLSATDCPCYGQNDYTESLSGLYLDGVERMHLDLIKGAENCADGNLWEMMAKARSEGILMYRTNLMSKIREMSRNKRNSFTGEIGYAENKNSTVSLNKTYAGLMIAPCRVRGGTLRIKRIGMKFNAATAMDVYLMSNEGFTMLIAASVTTAANALQWNVLDAPIELPMKSDMVQTLRYYLYYTVAGSPAPIDNKVMCGCAVSGNVNRYHRGVPTFEKAKDQRYAWTESLVVKGVQGDVLTEADDWTTSDFNNGLFLDVEIYCKPSIICYDEINFDQDEYAMVHAYGVQYTSAAILIGKIRSTNKINRYTMLAEEILQGLKKKYENEADERTSYLADKLTEVGRINKFDDCLSCKPTSGMAVVGIRI